MNKQRLGPEPYTHMEGKELTADDWKALHEARALFEQIALYGNGKRKLIQFAQAILKDGD